MRFKLFAILAVMLLASCAPKSETPPTPEAGSDTTSAAAPSDSL